MIMIDRVPNAQTWLIMHSCNTNEEAREKNKHLQSLGYKTRIVERMKRQIGRFNNRFMDSSEMKKTFDVEVKPQPDFLFKTNQRWKVKRGPTDEEVKDMMEM